MILAATIVLFGGVLYIVRHGADAPDYRAFHGEPSDLCSVAAIVRFALTWHSRGIIQSGLLVLIATPILRVALSAFAFAREHDWLYLGLTLTVLPLLSYSLWHG